MFKIKRNKNNIYIKYKKISIINICILIIALIAMILFLAHAKMSDAMEAIPADHPEETLNKENIKFKKNSVTLKIGEQFTAEIEGVKYENILSFESSNKSVAVVNKEGKITAINEGTAEISAIIRPNYQMLTLNVKVIKEKTAVTETTVAQKEKYDIKKTTTQKSNNKDNIKPTYIDGMLIVNKSYALPKDYNPGIDYEAEEAFYKMQAAASKKGLNIYISSAFRSYKDQERIYNDYVSRDGRKLADTYSARPGHSEHQTGLAFDLNTIDSSFADTPEGKWIKNNAHKYGFIIRYPEGKENITGYMYEPWHIRYLGIENAEKVYKSKLTLEEYLDIKSVYAD